MCRGRVRVCRELVNGLFLITTGQQLLMLQTCSVGLTAAPQLSGVSLGGCKSDEGVGTRGIGEKPSQTSFQTPLPLLRLPTRQSALRGPFFPFPLEAPAGPTFSMRPAFSAELSSSLCSLSLSLCSLAFSLSTVSIWARWALEACVLAGPSTPGGLKEPRGPWPRAAGCGGGGCSRGCCRYWYCCCCWRNTGGTCACRILGNRRNSAQRLHRLTLEQS